MSSPKPWIELTRVHKWSAYLLMFWPFAWCFTMNAQSVGYHWKPFFTTLFYGLIASGLLHSAGCIWNDILDREIDRKVERTKRRPIADGRISVQGALIFMLVHLAILTLFLQTLDRLSWIIGMIAVYPLPGFYPLMKRFFSMPQAWLGVAMSMGAPEAWSMLRPHSLAPSILLSCAAWAWTMWYDTIYACQDLKDDKDAGLQSTALLFGKHLKFILGSLGMFIVASFAIIGYQNHYGLLYYILTVLGSAAHFTWQIRSLDPEDPKRCWTLFEQNGISFGFIVWTGFLAEYIASSV